MFSGAQARKYRILGEIGRGGMGVVYRARHLKMGIDVAIKTLATATLSMADRERFEREARAGATVGGNHIVKVYDIDTTHDGTLFMVMEFLQGASLELVLHDEAPMERDLLAWFAQVADALGIAHDHGFVHRDVKPANIFIVDAKPAYAKLLDFGISKLVARGEVGHASAVIGTPRFMSPEQLRATPIDGRADIFSLGATIYYALTGELPFTGSTAGHRITDALIGSYSSLAERRPDLPELLCAAVDRALAREPSERFRRATELAIILRETAISLDEGPTFKFTRHVPAALDRTVVARTEDQSERVLSSATGAGASRRSWLRIGIAGATLATAGAVWLSWRQESRETPPPRESVSVSNVRTRGTRPSDEAAATSAPDASALTTKPVVAATSASLALPLPATYRALPRIPAAATREPPTSTATVPQRVRDLPKTLP